MTGKFSRREFVALVPAALAAAPTALFARRIHAHRVAPVGEHPEPRPGIDGSNVLTAEDLAGYPDLIPLFDGVREIPHIADGIRCHCGCADVEGFRSLLSCYEESGMARHCEICQGQGRLAYSRWKEGQSLDQIRRVTDARYGSSYHADHSGRTACAHHVGTDRPGPDRRGPVTRAAVLGAGLLLLGFGAAPPLTAQEPVLDGRTREWLIASAVLAAPEPLRDSAEVRAWTAADELVVLREGSNGIICLADRPGDDAFSAACYHDSLEPFMERGRELRRQGVEGMRRNEVRWEEIRAGTLPMPEAAMVYNLRLPGEDFDPATTDPATGGRLHALYMAGATQESTGLPVTPGEGPWLMLPGTPSAHVMIALPPKRPQ